MLPYSAHTILLASGEPTLLAALETALTADGAQVEIVLSAEAALAALNASPAPTLALIDTALPSIELETPLSELLASVRIETPARRFPIVLISDAVTAPWLDRLAEGVIDDLLPRTCDPAFLRIRLDSVLRDHRRLRELELLREAAALNAQIDRLTGVYNRETMLAMLFRETDRVQRLKSSLCLILFDIDDFGHWNSRLGTEACDELLCQVATRSTRLLRSYDLLGRPGKDEFLMALPGCSSVNALVMAERLRMEVFSSPYRVGGGAIRLSACFGIANSLGRSPVVVLREAEQALLVAKATGPESIQCAGDFPEPSAAPVAFLSSTSEDELLAW
ncbi:MAG: GGDEF domain-containing protein [Terracidiphilus sp.]|jgi:diguanylate cyclase (GGDEF)-like protein